MSYGQALQKVNSWADFEIFIRGRVFTQTIPGLKHIALILQTYGNVYPGIRSSDRKSDMVDKLKSAFYGIKSRNDFQTYAEVRVRCEAYAFGWSTESLNVALAQPSAVPPASGAPAPAAGPSTAAAGSTGSAGFGVQRWQPQTATGGGSNGAAYPASSVPAPPERVPPTTAIMNAYREAARPAAINHVPRGPILLEWKTSPMWKPVQAITNMEQLPDITAHESHSNRKERVTRFVLPNDVIAKLNMSHTNPTTTPHYSLRLFCASSDHYRPLNARTNPYGTNKDIPIEYPSLPDVYVDGVGLPFKEKGLRGKAGSAPPFDLEKAPARRGYMPGRMISVAFGHKGPTTGKNKSISKKFFYQLVLAEITTKEELLTRLGNLQPTNAGDSLDQLRKQQDEDDDIVAGTASLSLKDPLSYMRISRPVRSKKCSHLQCFEAQWWVESNATHPQWLCPHCSKELFFDDLIIDGYVSSILKAVPDDYDDVILEPSGEWHTEDNKYASEVWRAAHPPPAPPAPAIPSVPPPSGPSSSTPGLETKPSLTQLNGNDSSNGEGAKRKVVEILDSDDEDSLRGKSSAAPSSRVSLSIPPVGARTGLNTPIIDLTLSDSEDEGPPPPPRAPAPVAANPVTAQVPRPHTSMGTSVSDMAGEDAFWRGNVNDGQGAGINGGSSSLPGSSTQSTPAAGAGRMPQMGTWD
ncbi:hypothetical protein L202_05113 [Cryptococcus amylolentus CBS 6039]|uniref:SP-RING-type domain-containing protein n=1 Tax=Cryptococcus amylolentus CBS 6039 TaxID=1295533 RepID=A0A1E3HNU3_9TREE|nr:hypothetical protein L202_05113 [Cryptococcus amylolentus CBS 6039]ODN78029.1 hypothetical protein L202_05113 [Cryptococcus amylolentus CBS 6039]